MGYRGMLLERQAAVLSRLAEREEMEKRCVVGRVSRRLPCDDAQQHM
jgi:hypothetical protein